MNPTKNILAIHDLSCFGRCALTVIIPTLSAMSYQVTPLPTALLSTHTGGFTNINFVDLSDTLMTNFEHMVYSGAKFDAVYSGFLGSAGQIDTVAHIIKKNPNAFILVDPVMGDDGVLYQTYTEEMKNRMCELCKLATAITPNITEAHFLLGDDTPIITYESEFSAAKEAKAIINKLYEKYRTKYIAITGIEYYDGDDRYICTATLSDGIYGFIPKLFAGTSYPGTGDLFASLLLGEMLKNENFPKCADFASDFVRDVVCDTAKYDTPVRDGVLLEKNLYRLFKGKY